MGTEGGSEVVPASQTAIDARTIEESSVTEGQRKKKTNKKNKKKGKEEAAATEVKPQAGTEVFQEDVNNTLTGVGAGIAEAEREEPPTPEPGTATAELTLPMMEVEYGGSIPEPSSSSRTDPQSKLATARVPEWRTKAAPLAPIVSSGTTRGMSQGRRPTAAYDGPWSAARLTATKAGSSTFKANATPLRAWIPRSAREPPSTAAKASRASYIVIWDPSENIRARNRRKAEREAMNPDSEDTEYLAWDEYDEDDMAWADRFLKELKTVA